MLFRFGVATEVSTLVVLPERTYESRYGRIVPTYNRQWNGYESLVTQLEAATAAVGDLIPEDRASSPLGHLLRELERAWQALMGGGTEADFAARSAERRVGKEGVSTCRSRWSPCN